MAIYGPTQLSRSCHTIYIVVSRDYVQSIHNQLNFSWLINPSKKGFLACSLVLILTFMHFHWSSRTLSYLHLLDHALCDSLLWLFIVSLACRALTLTPALLRSPSHSGSQYGFIPFRVQPSQISFWCFYSNFSLLASATNSVYTSTFPMLQPNLLAIIQHITLAQFHSFS